MKAAVTLVLAVFLAVLGACKRRPPTNPLTLITPFPTPTATLGVYLSPTQSPTPEDTATPTNTYTVSDTLTMSATATESPTDSASATESASFTVSPTWTPTRTVTRTRTPTATRTPVSYSAHVQPIFNSSCTSCHGSNGGLTLTSASSYAELADVPASSSCVGQPRVDKAGLNPDNSVLVKKISGSSCGSKMGNLNAGQIQLIRDWISQGALNN